MDTSRHTDTSRNQRRLSRLLHRVGDATSRSGVAAAVAGATAMFLVVLAADGFPQSWEVVFATVSSAITLTMVFVIQHTQSRQQIATQLKLDELIRTSPRADDRLVHIEVAADDELILREQNQLEHHVAVREADTGDPGR